MITSDNFEKVLEFMDYKKNGNIYEKLYVDFNVTLKVDVEKQKLYYPPEIRGGDRNDYYDDKHKENLVVFECVNRLLKKGYRPEDIELEKAWHLGHDPKSGRADICVVDSNRKMLFIIECKTFGKEYQTEYKNTINDGGQLFSYWQQEGSCKWILLYASTLISTGIDYVTDSINCSDDNNILASAKKDSTIKLYKDAHTVEELFEVWDETYEKRFCGDVVFRDDTKAYQIGVKPLRKIDLKDFSENDKVVNKFEEILRHNNVSDKENAFNRLIALFICKLVDEIQKSDNDEVEFQYKVGTDTYESLQDRLQRLHKEGMEKFMREEIFYVSDNYAEKLVQQYTGQKRQKMIEELRNTLRILKFYTNNDFAFKDVHNEELFYQNGKILVEIVQLFERYRIIGSNDVQMLGDLFEQLLNKGFKQNEGQFFTPIPITRFIWDSILLGKIIKKEEGISFPKIIDYACGAGHFLTQGFKAVNDYVLSIDPTASVDRKWAENKIYGIEKDYRLARVSKISLFMHGAGDGNIIFGDGLENYPEKNIVPYSFDVLVANPPYSVKAFKPHLKLKNNEFEIIEKITNDGSEIETLFVERIAQLLKPKGIAAVILPSSILNKDNESFVKAREIILQNFNIRSIVCLGGKTFGATGTNTIVLFLEKFDEPPKRKDMATDTITAVFEGEQLTDWEDNIILEEYLGKIEVSEEDFKKVIAEDGNYDEWEEHHYYGKYYLAFIQSTQVAQKAKQKSFQNASKEYQKEWMNRAFYTYVKKEEQEKLRYFAYVYNQMTLIIQSPDDNKDQEAFLGYKWSNRKGQEGIQIINPGGMLYNAENRFAEDSLSFLIRSMFSDEMKDIPEYEPYYYYLRLQDMIDFSGVSFNKVIKTNRIRIKKPKEGYELYQLSNKIFDTFLGDRVVADEQLVKDGKIPVYSANVFEPFGYINEENLEDYACDSVIWGIDGDWMVNVIPAGVPFYPTDHCGVIRVKDDSIIPKYLSLALEVEGNFERFSRNNRASTQRIKALSVLVPDKTIQVKVVKEIEDINQIIDEEKNHIRRCENEIVSKFIDMFGDPIYNSKNLPTTELINVVTLQRGHDLPEYARNARGKIPVYGSNGIVGYHDKSKIKGAIITGRSGTLGEINYTEEELWPLNTSLYSTDLHGNDIVYVAYLLKCFHLERFNGDAVGTPTLNRNDVHNKKIINVDVKEQMRFRDMAKAIEDEKMVHQKKLVDSLQKKKEVIEENFN